MTRPVLLNNIDHRDLRVATGYGAAYGDDAMSALTFPGEFRNVQAYYPIVFQKDAQGRFQPVALFGLEAGQNLFLDDSRWDAPYVPLAVQRQPFMIGMSDGQPMVHIDLDHPRVGASDGQALFLEHGGTSQYLDQASSILLALHEGLEETPAFVDTLLEHDLLESFVLDVELGGEQPHRLAGFYTIHEERLQALDGAALAKLHAAGHLQPIYMALASLSHLRDLIERQQQRSAGHA
ncbi:SapC family protein [Oleiagrimonas sp. C23AA]|uniref:SapC family protein n=1 Tax=Oleiagrimonas sp. C23AA TaxID=2719047 RepID=UPI00141FB34D|nr:SapC family protein [Oleiagrimonas sp. C23AA]NII11210.1 SapC family protein [Oleiagrimonas sp. C23AA]